MDRENTCCHRCWFIFSLVKDVHGEGLHGRRSSCCDVGRPRWRYRPVQRRHVHYEQDAFGRVFEPRWRGEVDVKRADEMQKEIG